MKTKSTPGISEQVHAEMHALQETVQALVESLSRLRNPIRESHQKVPQATNQLDKISQQTLAAAHRMLDTVEAINTREDEILKAVKRIAVAAKGSPEFKSDLELIEKSATENLDAAFVLMDALQFQDITSQQVDYAASLLEEIETKLSHILKVVGVEHEQIVAIESKMPKKSRAFDPHADLFEKKTEQSEIDALFIKKK